MTPRGHPQLVTEQLIAECPKCRRWFAWFPPRGTESGDKVKATCSYPDCGKKFRVTA